MADISVQHEGLRRLGDYRIVREVGRGGMGVVYEAEQESLGRRVALKVLPGSAAADSAAIERFRREARSAAQLHHTNIVPVFDVGQIDGTFYYAMQFIAGEGLDHVIQRMRCHKGPGGGDQGEPIPSAAGAKHEISSSLPQGPPGNSKDRFTSTPVEPATPQEATEGLATEFYVPKALGATTGSNETAAAAAVATGPDTPLPLAPREYFRAVARIGQQAASAVAYAHARGIIHRDVKPSNLMLEGSVVWVTDFGLARGESDGLTAPGEIVGTLRYMAPERFRGDCDGRADVYSLGLTLYEFLTLRPAFETRDRVQLIEEVQSREPPRLRAVAPQVPRDLETIISKAIDKDPRKRYQTADAFGEDLRRFLADEPIRARRVSNAERLVRWCRRHPREAVLGGVIFALLAAITLGSFAVAVWMRGQRDEVLDERRRANEAEHARHEQLVRDVLTTAPDNVPFILDTLRSSREDAIPSLRRALDDPAAGPRARLRAAVALTLLGQPQPGPLLDAVANAPAAESRHLLAALAAARETVLGPLHRRARDERQAAVRTRLAITLVYLGDPGMAQALLAAGPAPAARAAFIEDFPSWRGDLSQLPDFLRTHTDPDLRSGLCAAVGRIDPEDLSADERRAVEQVLTELFSMAPDCGTHSAADWALRRWKVKPPALPRSDKPAAGRHWFVNAHGMTMLEVPAGGMSSRQDGKVTNLTILPRPFFLCDRETTVALFQQFLADRDYPATQKPQGWPGPIRAASPTDDCPIGNSSWVDALLFCNWLSKKEGRPPCYWIVIKNGTVSWGWDRSATGYRLPTSAEWDYAYRAGATTLFPTGDEPDLLIRYGNVELMRALPGGQRQPSPWGLFDMCGNVWELCYDIWGSDYPSLAYDPVLSGGDPTKCVNHGGAFGAGSYYSRTNTRFSADRMYRNGDGSTGFRVACTLTPREGPGEPALAAGERYAATLAGQPDRPKEAAAWHECARFAMHLKQWDRSATALRRVIALDPENHLAWYEQAALLAYRKDAEGYRRHCHEMLRRFGASEGPKIAERTAKACLLAPLAAEDVATAARLAEKAVSSKPPHPMPEYAKLALALAEYRRGQFADADKRVEWLLLWKGHPWNLTVPGQLLQAMAQHQMGNVPKARQMLARSLTHFREGTQEPGLDETWHDWLICQVLRREAEALITPSGGPP